MIHFSERTLAIAAVCLLTGAGLALPAAAENAPALYRFAEGPTPTVKAGQRVERILVDPAPLSAAAATIALPLPTGQVAVARRDAVERRGPDSLSWRGMVDDGGRVTLTLHKGILAGRAEMPDGPYEIATSPAGPLLIKLAMDQFDACGNEVPAANELPTTFHPSPVTPGLSLIGEDPPDQIDVMILYTPPARDGAGGVAQIEATAQAAVDAANGAYADSDMVQRLRLVHVELINYMDSGNVFNDRNFLQQDPGTAALRDEMRADMVGMITEDGGGFCGVAFLMGSGADPAVVAAGFAPFGFQVTARVCAVGNFTYAHEHGHNMGFQHNPANGAPPASALFPYAYGHQVTGVARTVMSTQGGCCNRVGHFANPAVDFMPPAAAGNASGITDARENARVGDFVAPFTANWRSGTGIFADGFESMDTSAWSSTIP